MQLAHGGSVQGDGQSEDGCGGGADVWSAVVMGRECKTTTGLQAQGRGLWVLVARSGSFIGAVDAYPVSDPTAKLSNSRPRVRCSRTTYAVEQSASISRTNITEDAAGRGGPPRTRLFGDAGDIRA